MTTMITGARIRIRHSNQQTWLYLGRLKLGRIEAGYLEVKGHGKGNPIERAPLAEVGRMLMVLAAMQVDKIEASVVNSSNNI